MVVPMRLALLVISIGGLASAETRTTENVTIEENCTPAAIFEFPSDGLTREQRRSGWIAVHVLLTCYCFIVLSTVCDDFFVPGIQTLVKKLKMSEDVAGASFMAITSASPELFINFVGTFVTEGDIGVGTVVGSNVFNILAAPACCALFTKMTFQFEWYSIMRDGLVYGVSVVMLIATLYDDKVYWYEALTLVLAYMVYITAIYFDKSVHKLAAYCIGKPTTTIDLQALEQLNASNTEIKPKIENKYDTSGKSQLWSFPKEKVFYKKFWWGLVWPALVLTSYTIPNCKKSPNYYPLTLLMCMVWIGVISYVLAWLITAIGDTISIPDSVMGLSFLAVGSSMPEIVSCIIVSRQGQGVMGMSSALGANTFEVLLCLGLPWLIKTCFYPRISGNHWININSSGLAYNATCLLSTLVFLYVCLVCNRLKLDKKIGLTCLVMYVLFLIVGTLIELNIFFVVNLPTCF